MAAALLPDRPRPGSWLGTTGCICPRCTLQTGCSSSLVLTLGSASTQSKAVKSRSHAHWEQKLQQSSAAMTLGRPSCRALRALGASLANDARIDLLVDSERRAKKNVREHLHQHFEGVNTIEAAGEYPSFEKATFLAHEAALFQNLPESCFWLWHVAKEATLKSRAGSRFAST